MSDKREASRKAGYKGAQPQPEKPPQARSAAGQFQLGLNYTAQAEQVIQELKRSMGRDYQNFTTSKIRNVLAKVSEIYNDVRAENDEVLSLDLQSRIEYLKVRLVYECGREPRVVKPFVVKAKLLDLLNSIGDSRQKFIEFARYMEALVAYHRFYDGRD